MQKNLNRGLFFWKQNRSRFYHITPCFQPPHFTPKTPKNHQKRAVFGGFLQFLMNSAEKEGLTALIPGWGAKENPTCCAPNNKSQTLPQTNLGRVQLLSFALRAVWFSFAEKEGFEPPEACTSTVFKTAAIDHSAISPLQKYNFLDYLKMLFQNLWHFVAERSIWGVVQWSCLVVKSHVIL